MNEECRTMDMSVDTVTTVIPNGYVRVRVDTPALSLVLGLHVIWLG